MITVIDYGGGNLKSVTNLLEVLNCKYQVTSDFDLIAGAEKIIFPGQGHFGQSMKSIKSKNIDKAIIESINNGIPFLGICVGLQVLFEESEEAPGIQGLGVIKGKVVRFIQGKIPQIGWNKLKTTSNNTILSEDYYYFVNSYYVKPEDESLISSYANYYIDFAASIEHKNLTAVQFHPEKSGTVGFNSIKKWVAKPL
ncbi:MAG: imidazole glycerol phosphate synthase subunit HisH [Candidatus Gastranaerophilaceae bacterium]|jgi:glutamine amidotransferase